MSKLGLRLHADEEHWIPLSDLMTGLMFLFLVIALAYMVAADLKQSKPASVLRGYETSRAQINDELEAALGPKLGGWNASIDPATLSVRFLGNASLFKPGSAQLKPQFQIALRQFFPRYVSILAAHRASISEVRIEGYTSTRWPRSAEGTQKYLADMALAQDRTRAVLDYVLRFKALQPQLPWLTQVISADGFSSSHLIRDNNGAEDATASDRVEFRILTDANAKIAAALQLAPAPVRKAQPSTAPLSIPESAQSLPEYPAWSRAMIGLQLSKLFPHTVVRCYGYLDSVLVEYTGNPPGAEVSGWAFDLHAWRRVDRVLLVDAHGTIVGAADGGGPRPDVESSIKWIKSANTGWRGSVGATNLAVTPWAIMHDGTVCQLNVAENLKGEKI